MLASGRVNVHTHPNEQSARKSQTPEPVFYLRRRGGTEDMKASGRWPLAKV
jgi:hypothetical protein